MDKEKRKALEEVGFRIGDAEDFLGLSEEERRLVHEERVLAIAAARRKRFADWLRTIVQLLVTLAALIVAAVLVMLVRDAVVARSVVVDPFRTPPILAAGGVSGIMPSMH